MWSDKSRRILHNCTHQRLEISVAAGLQRRICLACGNVSISFASDSVETDWLDRQPAD